jgi:hypothetical protein
MLRRCRTDYDGYRNNDGGRDDLRTSRAAMAMVIVNDTTAHRETTKGRTNRS